MIEVVALVVIALIAVYLLYYYPKGRWSSESEGQETQNIAFYKCPDCHFFVETTGSPELFDLVIQVAELSHKGGCRGVDHGC